MLHLLASRLRGQLRLPDKGETQAGRGSSYFASLCHVLRHEHCHADQALGNIMWQMPVLCAGLEAASTLVLLINSVPSSSP